MITGRWIISHRCSWMAVYVLWCIAQSSLRGVKMISICMYCFLDVCQLPCCNFFTQHVIYLRRATSSELWIPVLIFYIQSIKCLLLCVYFLQTFTSFHSILLILCFLQNTVRLTTSSQVGDKVMWLCCAGLHVATSTGSAPFPCLASNTFGVFP